MISVYYPYFMLENEAKVTIPYAHKKYLRVLSLFCDNILIPCRHLLTMRDDEFNELASNQLLFHEKIIYYRLPDDTSNILNYYENIKHHFKSTQQEIAQERVKKIDCIYSGNYEKIQRYNPKKQILYYTSKIKEFLKLYFNNKHNIKGSSEIIEYIENKDMITKEEFDSLIKSKTKNNCITKNIYKRLVKASEAIYFLSGASTESLIVCHDKYFDYPCIKSELKLVFNDYDDIINPHYSPEKILNFLIRMDVLSAEDDIKCLLWDEISTIRNHKDFKNAIKEYKQLHARSSNDVSEYIYKTKSFFKWIINVKNGIISVIIGIIGSIFSIFLRQTLINNVIISLGCTFIAWVITNIFKVTKQEIPFVEKFIYNIIGKMCPLKIYLLHIKLLIERKNPT